MSQFCLQSSQNLIKAISSADVVGYEGFEFSAKPSAHPAVEEEVDGRVEDKQDVVEMRDAEKPGGHTVATMPGRK